MGSSHSDAQTGRWRQLSGGLMVGVLLAAAMIAVAPSAATAEGTGNVVTDLRAENLVTPLGLDVTNPRLSWQVQSSKRGTEPAAHRVLVGSSPEHLDGVGANVWDSGWVEDDGNTASLDEVELEPSTRYHWLVEVEIAGEGIVRSAPTWFETGIGDEGWEGSDWIAAPELSDEREPSIEDATWIWHPDGEAPDAPEGTRFLRTVIDLDADADIDSTDLVIAADDGYAVSVNGEEVGRSADDPEAWRTAGVYPIDLDPGRNVVAVEAWNLDFPDGQMSPAGVLASVEARFADGTSERHVTDSTWRTSTSASEGWDEADFDDAEWAFAQEHAPYGEGPWEDNVVVATTVDPAPLFRHDFSLDAPVERARLYVTAGGYVTSTINGEATSNEVLSPGPTDYRDRVAYATHDVTDLLVEGDNAIAAEVGRGFFSVTTPNSWDWDQAPWRDDPQMRALLVVDHADGTTTRIGTGEDWSTTAGPRLADSIYEGDVYDARLELEGHERAGFDDADWTSARVLDGPAGNLEGRRVQPVGVVETLEAVEVTNPEPDVHIFHFPRQVAGWPRIHVEGPAGTEIRLRSSELLTDEGDLDLSTGFSGGEFQTDRYTLSGAPDGESWEPSFSYKGFQYVEVTGWPGDAPVPGDIEARVVHNDLERTGRFTSDIELFEQIHEATIATVLNNFHDVPTDTPKYEKNGWTGDAVLGGELFLRNLDVVPLLDKWLDDVSDARWDDGRPALIAPNPDWSWADHSPTWHSAYVMLPWEVYQHTGDVTLLQRHYDGIVAYMELELDATDDGIATTELGDYLPPDAVGNPPEDMRIAATAYVHEMVKTTAAIAEVLGNDDDVQQFRAAAEEVAAAFHDTFFDAAAGAYVGQDDDGFRQTHQVLALAFDLVPDEHVDSVVDALVSDIESRDDALWTGVLGTKYLLRVLTEHGHGELAYRVATRTEFPSWGRWFEEGATSLWEHWSDYRSRNHYFLGTIDDWFAGDLAGVRPTSPGYRTFEVVPHLLDEMRHAGVAFDTPLGEVSSQWRSDGDVLDLEVEVPVGATARIHVPRADAVDDIMEGKLPAAEAEGVTVLEPIDARPVLEVASGSYHFRIGADEKPGDEKPSDEEPGGPQWPQPPFERGVERVCASPPPAPFVDVSSSGVHADTIACMADQGLTAGSRDPTRYEPRSSVTRAQMASFLVRFVERAAGEQLPEGSDAFDDDDGSPHDSAINKLAATGVAQGMGDGKFGPTEPVTRAQMASLLDRTLDLLDDGELNGSAPPRADVGVFPAEGSSVHGDAIDRLVAAGVVQGWPDGRFRPSQPVRRDQTASLVMRAYDAAVELGYVEP